MFDQFQRRYLILNHLSHQDNLPQIQEQTGMARNSMQAPHFSKRRCRTRTFSR